MKKFSLNAIQKEITWEKLDGWLFCDFMGSDPVGRSILKISPDIMNSRRWFYFIPSHGVPIKFVHTLENKILDHLPGRKEVYIGWKEMVQLLQRMIKSKSRIAVQYSAKNAIPMISCIDAGMFELLRSFGLNLISSGDLVQKFDACLSKPQINTHINTSGELQVIFEKTVRYIKRNLKNHQEVTELGVQKFLQNQIQSCGLVSSLPQIIAVGRNTRDPRYFPTNSSNKPIHNKSLIQLSLRARDKSEDAIYASASWVVYVGNEVPEKFVDNFRILKNTRNRAFEFIQSAMKKAKPLYGWEVDEYAREIIRKEKLDSNYLHRTGHSLGNAFYGNGVNLDNLETRDERMVIPGLCFTIVPGLYFSDYGMRSEINLYVDAKAAHMSTPQIQEDIVQIIPQK